MSPGTDVPRRSAYEWWEATAIPPPESAHHGVEPPYGGTDAANRGAMAV